MSQNRSSAVMAQRKEAPDSLDYFPTPPWGTRALLAHADSHTFLALEDKLVWEPACGEGYMARPLAERFGRVVATDCHDYGAGYGVHDFLMPYLPHELLDRRPDWIITNPPYNAAEQFVLRALEVAQEGVAVLVRSTWLESEGRYSRLFSRQPPQLIAQFVERLPMWKGRVVRDGGTATAYAWVIWVIGGWDEALFRWIPPCRKTLERDDDYPPAVVASAPANPLELLMMEGGDDRS